MSIKIRTSFLLTFALILFASTPRLAFGQAPPRGNAATDKAAAEKAAAEKAAAEKAADDAAAIQDKAIKEAAEKQAAKDAEKNAAERANVKKEFDDNPLTVTCIEPYVESDEKGTCDHNDPTKAIPGKARMGDRITVVISRLSRAAEYGVVEPTKLVLFIDGRVFPGVYPISVGYDFVVYKLERTKDALDAWNGLLGSPGLEPNKPVVVSVGDANKKPLEMAKGFPQKTNLNLIVYRKRWAVGCLIFMILMLLVLWKKGKDMLRDAGPPTPRHQDGKDAEKPYSLAKVQVAWWFILVVGCFLLIYLITGEYTMTEQTLILIGIGTGTALGSAMIDASKRNNSDTELETLRPQVAKLKTEVEQLREDKAALVKSIEARKEASSDSEKALLNTDKESLKAKNVELAQKEAEQAEVLAKIEDAQSAQSRPISEGPWKDLVTDANGPSFHRFQMIAWTVILGVLFLADVYKNLAMPEFSGTMLALMGISAGTYLGFKIPEKQNTAEEIEKAKAAEKAKEEAEAKAKADMNAKAKGEADAKAKEEAAAKKKAETEEVSGENSSTEESAEEGNETDSGGEKETTEETEQGT